MTYELPDEVREAVRTSFMVATPHLEDAERGLQHFLTNDLPILAAHFERSGAEKMREAAAEVAFQTHQDLDVETVFVPEVIRDRIRALPLPSQATNPTEEA